MAATVSLIQMLAAGFANTDGTPAASARARFYQPATLTPVTVYADTQAATAITPPLILTAGGTGTAYTQQPTRLIVKDATDTNTLFDGNVNTTRAESDYIQSAAVNGGAETRLQTVLDGWSTAFGGSAGIWTYKAYSDATERNPGAVLTEMLLSVKNYGAVGDGVTDDTAAIQATITRVSTAGGGIVYIPAGTYQLSSALSIGTTGVNIIGSGAKSILRQTNATAGVLAFSTTGLVYINHLVERLKITHATTTTGTAISGQCLALDDIIIDGPMFRTGVDASGGLIWIIRNSTIRGNSADANSNAVNISGAVTAMISGCFIEKAGSSGSAIRVATSLNVISGCYVDATASATSTGITVAGTGSATISSCVVSGGVSSKAISIAAGAYAVIEHAQSIGNVLDSRTSTTAPVGYVLTGSVAVTPLPLQAESIRVEAATGGATITVNAIAATESGRKWTLACVNNSGGAVTWTFNAQYKLSGAVAPGTGNMIILLLQYDPIDTVVREVSRSGTIAI